MKNFKKALSSMKGKVNFRKLLMIGVFFASMFFLFPQVSLAQRADPIDVNFAANLGLEKGTTTDLRVIIVNIIKYLLSFVGLIAVVIIMWAGFLWMTSQGDADKINQAKRTLINAMIGLAIIIAAFAIVMFINSLIENALSGKGNGPNGNNGNGGVGLGASGNRVIESHYPARNQSNVARNTSIVVTFKEPMKVTDLIAGSSGLACGAAGAGFNTSNIKIFKTTDNSQTAETNFSGAFTCDKKTFRFRQLDSSKYLGSPSENVKYTVKIETGIKKANNEPAWAGAGGGYDWTFETGTFVDSRPPQIASVIPSPASTEPRNVVVQINFDEGVDPIMASGDANTGGFENIIASVVGVPIKGYYYISNQYTTVEFVTIIECGKNSCGQKVYCLPENSDISVLVKAADLSSFTNGIVDLASNSLDGNMNGKAEGPGFGGPYNANVPNPVTQGDSYVWSFKTTNEIDLVPPFIQDVKPGYLAFGITADTEPSALFSKYIMSSSVTKNSNKDGSVALYANPSSVEVFYWFSNHNATSTKTTTVNIAHQGFVKNGQYIPEFNSGVRDIYQNCFNPARGSADPLDAVCTPDATNPYCCNGVAKMTSCDKP